MKKSQLLMFIFCFSIIFISQNVFATQTTYQDENHYQIKTYLKEPQWSDPEHKENIYRDVSLNNVASYKNQISEIKFSTIQVSHSSPSYSHQCEEFEHLNSYLRRQCDHFENLRYKFSCKYLTNNIQNKDQYRQKSENLMENLSQSWISTHQDLMPFLCQGYQAFSDKKAEEKFHQTRSKFHQTCYDILDFIKEIEEDVDIQHQGNLKWFVSLVDLLPSHHPFFNLHSDFGQGTDFYGGNIVYDLADLIHIAEKNSLDFRITNDLKKQAKDLANIKWQAQQEDDKHHNRKKKKSFKAEIIINYILGERSQSIISKWYQEAINIRQQKNQSDTNTSKNRSAVLYR